MKLIEVYYPCEIHDLVCTKLENAFYRVVSRCSCEHAAEGHVPHSVQIEGKYELEAVLL
jgi:hypothetical protein